MTLKTAALAALALTAGACASRPSAPPAPQGPAAGIDRAESLLAAGRKLKAEKGCAAAAPTFRVISSFGDGYEVAQFELGACLLEIGAGDGPEAALFRDEGLLWLRRAAWAGEARAQRTLALVLSGAPGAAAQNVAAAPAEALRWLLVFDRNPAHKLYGFDPIAAPVISHVRAALSAQAVADAESFAANFTPIAMASFTPPARDGVERRERAGPAGGAHRRRR